MVFHIQLQAVLGFLLLVFLYCIWTKSPKSKHKVAPEPAGCWPIIGHLHLLRSHEQPARILGALADKYGSIYKLRLGKRHAIAVNSWESAKECFTTNDKALATRLSNMFGKYLTYDYAMFGFAPYGPYWREIRKLATLEVLSNHQLDLLKHVRAAEVNASMKGLYEKWTMNHKKPVKVEMKQRFTDLLFNMAVMMVAGKRFLDGNGNIVGDYEEAKQFQEAINQWFYFAGLFIASDAFTFLEWIDFQGHKKDMKRTAEKMDSLLVRWLEEHRQRRLSGEEQGNQDFMDVLLSIMQNADIRSYDPDTIIKATSWNIIAAGTDTTAIALTWAVSLLLNHPNTLKKAQDELDIHVGQDRHVDESDIKNLIYLQAIIKETLRLYPPAPVIGAHEAMEDCHVSGFYVPAGTEIILNIWKVQRDPRMWLDSTEFRPERFLTSHVDLDFRGQQFEYIPFGSGRRSCPGISMALQMTQLTLAHLIHRFDMATPTGEPVDMSEGLGLTMPKTTPLEVLLTPRLPLKLYE